MLTTEGMTSLQLVGARRMPFEVREVGDQWCVFTEGTDHNHGCHDTEAEAQAQQRALYANVPEARKDDDGMLSFLGGEVKSLGNGRIGGYLVTFGDATQPDLSEWRDFFTKATDYGSDEWPFRVPVLFHHGLHPEVGRRRLGMGTLKMDDHGVFIEAVLKEHDRWARALLLAMEQKSEVTGRPPLLWSSGAATHLVAREAVKSTGETIAHRITEWPIVEASLTPTPAEPRCQAVALKSLELPEWPPPPGGCACGNERKSLAERTEIALDLFEDVLTGYQSVRDAQVKVGRALSAARRERLQRARALIDELLAETDVRDDSLDAGTPDTPGTGVVSLDTGQPVKASITEMPDWSDLFTLRAQQESFPLASL